MKTARNLIAGSTYVLEDGRKVIYKGYIPADGHYVNVIGKETEAEECLPVTTKFFLPQQQRRYKSKFELEAEIIKQRRHLSTQTALANTHEAKMRVHWDRANSTELDTHAQEHARQRGFNEKKLMERNLNNARRIEEVKLPKLKQALAAFCTKTFDFSADDKSVVVN